MKVIACMLVALALAASLAAPANAFDAKSFFDQQERQSGGAGGS